MGSLLIILPLHDWALSHYISGKMLHQSAVELGFILPDRFRWNDGRQLQLLSTEKGASTSCAISLEKWWLSCSGTLTCECPSSQVRTFFPPVIVKSLKTLQPFILYWKQKLIFVIGSHWLVCAMFMSSWCCRKSYILWADFTKVETPQKVYWLILPLFGNVCESRYLQGSRKSYFIW